MAKFKTTPKRGAFYYGYMDNKTCRGSLSLYKGRSALQVNVTIYERLKSCYRYNIAFYN